MKLQQLVLQLDDTSNTKSRKPETRKSTRQFPILNSHVLQQAVHVCL